MPKRLFIAIAVTAVLALAAIFIFGFFSLEEEGDRSAPPAHVEPAPSTPAPTAPANP
jgi:flagellar basal body-associated protein FliL